MDRPFLINLIVPVRAGRGGESTAARDGGRKHVRQTSRTLPMIALSTISGPQTSSAPYSSAVAPGISSMLRHPPSKKDAPRSRVGRVPILTIGARCRPIPYGRALVLATGAVVVAGTAAGATGGDGEERRTRLAEGSSAALGGVEGLWAREEVAIVRVSAGAVGLSCERQWFMRGRRQERRGAEIWRWSCGSGSPALGLTSWRDLEAVNTPLLFRIQCTCFKTNGAEERQQTMTGGVEENRFCPVVVSLRTRPRTKQSSGRPPSYTDLRHATQEGREAGSAQQGQT